MNMMKKMLVILMGILMIACGKEDETIKIGVTQIIEHPALDNTVKEPWQMVAMEMLR